ncbi:interleukin-12 subunit alpha [Genypterus blacodes]|uniref:interleukin-12 subunit alpha n=1 Tax=Genypterus blacodes TaxID=154954 RepID=UPI003F75D52A
MANFTVYVASCTLLLLSCFCRTAPAVPVPVPAGPELSLSAERCARCSVLLNTLLSRVTLILQNNVFCQDNNTESMNSRMNSQADTVQACTPTLQNSSCMAQRSSPFSESQCVENIMKDLTHYAAAFHSYLNHPMRSPDVEEPPLRQTLETIQSLRESCSLVPIKEPPSSSEENTPHLWGSNTFGNRYEMCKLMKGFHMRTITINRAMGYIASGEHRK